MTDMLNARRVMVDNQIRTFDVTDRGVLAAFDRVPREAFVAAKDRAIAYADRPLTVGEGAGARSLLTPLVLARLIQALQPQEGERALDVMSGTGYPAAVFAAIGLETSFIEADAATTELARASLAEAAADVAVLSAQAGISATGGAKLAGPGFDVILVNGASEREPEGFFPLLRNGGRLGIFRREGGVVRALVYLKSSGNTAPRRAFDAAVSVLPGFATEPGFVF